MQKKNKDTFIM